MIINETNETINFPTLDDVVKYANEDERLCLLWDFKVFDVTEF
jgi:hypothetical protein